MSVYSVTPHRVFEPLCVDSNMPPSQFVDQSSEHFWISGDLLRFVDCANLALVHNRVKHVCRMNEELSVLIGMRHGELEVINKCGYVIQIPALALVMFIKSELAPHTWQWVTNQHNGIELRPEFVVQVWHIFA